MMRKLTELLIAARGRVTLESVHGTADAADDLRIVRTALQVKAFFVQGLQELLRALEE